MVYRNRRMAWRCWWIQNSRHGILFHKTHRRYTKFNYRVAYFWILWHIKRTRILIDRLILSMNLSDFISLLLAINKICNLPYVNLAIILLSLLSRNRVRWKILLTFLSLRIMIRLFLKITKIEEFSDEGETQWQ